MTSFLSRSKSAKMPSVCFREIACILAEICAGSIAKLVFKSSNASLYCYRTRYERPLRQYDFA